MTEQTTSIAWGPAGQPAAIGITFDNLGEAMEITNGLWPADTPVGAHPSVMRTLPAVLDVLDELALPATYFAEGWSAGVYPNALGRLVAAGHEVAYHGWLHEHWSGLEDRDRESELIRRGVEAMAERGIRMRGFRPPGGGMTPWTVELAREHGFTYLSPAARRTGLLADDLVALPFIWTAIDAYYAWDAFAPLRRQLGDPDEVLPAGRMVDAMVATIDATVADGGCLTLLFHPFLLGEVERFEAMREVLTHLAGRDDVWCATCAELADWALGQRTTIARDPQLDERSWR